MSSSSLSPLSVSEIQQAERAIIRYVQWCAFDKEFHLLQKQCNAHEFSSAGHHSDLQKLTPTLSIDGLLCVGGRLRKAQTAEDPKHPMIVPNDSVVAKLIVRHCHAAANHAGQEHTLALLRERFWIVRAWTVVHTQLMCYQRKKRAV